MLLTLLQVVSRVDSSHRLSKGQCRTRSRQAAYPRALSTFFKVRFCRPNRRVDIVLSAKLCCSHGPSPRAVILLTSGCERSQIGKHGRDQAESWVLPAFVQGRVLRQTGAESR